MPIMDLFLKAAAPITLRMTYIERPPYAGAMSLRRLKPARRGVFLGLLTAQLAVWKQIFKKKKTPPKTSQNWPSCIWRSKKNNTFQVLILFVFFCSAKGAFDFKRSRATRVAVCFTAQLCQSKNCQKPWGLHQGCFPHQLDTESWKVQNHYDIRLSWNVSTGHERRSAWCFARFLPRDCTKKPAD